LVAVRRLTKPPGRREVDGLDFGGAREGAVRRRRSVSPALVVGRHAAADGLLHLLACGIWRLWPAPTMVLLVVIGEQRRESREDAVNKIYRRLGEADDSADR
jgi:hypothetical protein